MFNEGPALFCSCAGLLYVLYIYCISTFSSVNPDRILAVIKTVMLLKKSFIKFPGNEIFCLVIRDSPCDRDKLCDVSGIFKI